MLTGWVSRGLMVMRAAVRNSGICNPSRETQVKEHRGPGKCIEFVCSIYFLLSIGWWSNTDPFVMASLGVLHYFNVVFSLRMCCHENLNSDRLFFFNNELKAFSIQDM